MANRIAPRPRPRPALARRRPGVRPLFGGLIVALLVAGSAHAAPVSLDGRLEVRNDRNTAVTLTIDGDHAGVVAARSAKVFANVKNGVRVVGYTSVAAPVRDQQVAVPMAATATLKIAPVLGSARIHNESGVTMRLRLDGRKLGRVAPGATVASMALPAGRYVLTARPKSRGAHRGSRKLPILSQEITIRAGQITQTSLKPWLASLEVRNPSRTRLAVYVDGTRVADVPGHGAVVVSGQLPGPHDVSLRGRGAILAGTRVDLGPGARELWTPAIARRGRVRVTNHTRKTYTFSVAGSAAVAVPPGETRLVADLQPGQHTFQARPRRGPALHTAVEIVADQVSDVTLAQPLPAHRVTRPVPVQVRVTL